jgi:hypothetical protein
VTDQREHRASCFLYDDELLAEVQTETTGVEGQP